MAVSLAVVCMGLDACLAGLRVHHRCLGKVCRSSCSGDPAHLYAFSRISETTPWSRPDPPALGSEKGLSILARGTPKLQAYLGGSPLSQVTGRIC